MLSRTLLFTLAASLLACGGPAEDTRPGQPVKHRQEAFKAMLRSFEPMGTMLRDNRYDPERFLSLATTLNTQRDTPWPHFGPETDYPPSKAKPEVWTRAAEFEQARREFIAATDELLLAAQEKNSARATQAHSRVYDSCQSCHRTFRNK